MKRDITVVSSLLLFIALTSALILMGAPSDLTNAALPFQLMFWGMWACALRAVVLWFQTLVHAVKYSPVEDRVLSVIGLVVLGVIGAYIYYFRNRDVRRTRSTQPHADG